MRKPGNAIITDSDFETLMSDLSLQIYVLGHNFSSYEKSNYIVEAVDHPKWQEFTAISANGDYSDHHADSSFRSMALESYYEVIDGAKFISYYGKNYSFGWRLYDENFNYIGYSNKTYSRMNTCFVKASDNSEISADIKYVKFFTNHCNTPYDEYIDDNIILIGLIPVRRKFLGEWNINTITKYHLKNSERTLIPAIPIVKDHFYLAYIKSDKDIVSGTDYMTISLEFNGAFKNGHVSGRDLTNGLYFMMQANTSHPCSRLYITTSGTVINSDIKIEANLLDLTDNNIIKPFSIEDFSVASAVQKTANSRTEDDFNSMLTIIHVSDIHGDEVRHQNMVNFAKKLAASDCTVVIVNTGDSVAYDGYDGTYYLEDQYYSKYGIKYLITTGNHEYFNKNGIGAISESYVYNNLITPFIEDNSYQITSGKTYYYSDISSHNIRFIILNPFEVGGMSTEQITWFINTLKSTPSNYGIIVAMHAPLLDVIKVEESETFYQDANLWRWDTMGYPELTKIIDLFIDGGNENVVINNNTFTVNFSNKNSGVEFIAWMNGHEHCDKIGYYDKTGTLTLNNNQLVLNITCTNSWINLHKDQLKYDKTDYPYYTENSDIPRKIWTSTENCFNVYCIDRTNKKVRIGRIGANITSDFKKRDFMEISYI